MKPTHAVLGLATLALAVSGAYAADPAKSRQSDPPGFNQLDKDNDGHVTKAEAARNANLAKRFDQADGDKDGKLTRAEYLKVAAAKDFRSLRQQVADFVEPGSEGEKPERPGFNELDKNGDGKVSRAEAKASRELSQRWQDTDDDKDGFVTRTEYLKTMAAVDWQNARENMAEFIRPDSKASAGGSKPK